MKPCNFWGGVCGTGSRLISHSDSTSNPPTAPNQETFQEKSFTTMRLHGVEILVSSCKEDKLKTCKKLPTENLSTAWTPKKSFKKPWTTDLPILNSQALIRLGSNFHPIFKPRPFRVLRLVILVAMNFDHSAIHFLCFLGACQWPKSSVEPSFVLKILWMLSKLTFSWPKWP